jgi:hypothetical protein
MALVKVGERFWTAKTRTEVETQFGNADDFPKDSIVRIVTGADAGDYYWDPSSSATAGAGVIAVPGETGRFLLGASGTSTPSVSSSAAGSAASFPAGERRIFHSDGTTAGGTWAPLSPTDVAAAFDEKSIAADRLAIGANGQILTTVSGVATWAAPATVTSSANGVANAFPAGSRRIFHSDGSTAGGTWAQLTSTDVSAAFADASIVAAKINIGSGTEGQVIKIVSGVATFTDESGTGASPVTSSVSGTVNAFTASQRRIFHSDGSTAGGVWTQLSALDVTGAFAAASIGAGILTPGTNGQVLTTSGGVATWAAPVTTALVGTATAGSANQFPSGSRRILHSDGSTAGGTWDQLSALDVTGAFTAGSIGASIITPGTTGQVLTTSGGVATWAAPVTTAAVSSSVAGTATAFPAGSRRIFHSDGSAAGGTWSQLSALDVTGSFAAASIGAGLITPGTAGQVLTTSGGVATWAAAPTTPFVSSSVAGTASAFPAGSRRIFHSDGTTAGGVWTQMSETDVTGSFAAASIASSILKPGTNGQVLTTSGGVATWAAPTLTIAGATTGDMLVYSSGAWNRLPISTEPNAPLVQMGGLPAWSPLSTGPTVALPAGTTQGLDVSMVGYGDARLVVVDLAGPATLRSINPVGWRPGYYMFQNLSVHTLTVKHNDETATLGTLFFIHGQQDITIPPDHWLMVFYDGMFIVVTDASDKFLGPGVQGDILYRNANQWTTLSAGTAGKSLITAGTGANPSWGYPTSATVILQPGYSGSAPNTYGTFATAWAAALAHGGPVTILVQSTGAALSIPTGVYDGGNRIGFLFQHIAGGLTISMASSSEIVDITSWANVSAWPDDSSVLTSISMGVGSPHTCGIYLSAASAGREFLYSGRFSWSGSRYSIRVDSNCAVRMRDLHHTGSGQEIRASDDLRIITENRCVPPQCNTLDSGATLYVLQQAGSVIDPDDFSWNGSGGVVVAKTDDVATTAYSAAVTTHWPEGAPAEPRDALDKLAARNPGARPPGAQLFNNNYWFVFDKDTENLLVTTATESLTLFVPQYNHWLLLGYFSNNTETDHRTLAVGYGKSFRRLVRSGFYAFTSDPDGGISSNFKRPLAAIVIPNGSGVRVVVSSQLVTAGTNCVATSDNGGETWTLRSGHFSSSTNGYRDFCWTGTHIIGIAEASGTTVGRSTVGTTWSSVTVSSAQRVKIVSNGAGTVIALTATGAIDRSTNHGANWTTASISGMAALFDAIWFDGKFVVMSTSGTVWTSTDGATWSSATPITINHPGKTGYTPYGYSYRSLVKCGGVLACLFKGVYDSGSDSQINIFWSLDGLTWNDSNSIDGTHVAAYDSQSFRFGIHLSSSSMNSLADADTDAHQMVVRIPGIVGADFTTAGIWAASPTVVADLVV